MSDIYKKFCLFMDHFGPYEMNPTIAVGVSGGIDSLSLTLMMHKWVQQYNGKIIALTVNHHLRAEAQEEAEFVQQFLKKYAITHHILACQQERITTNIQHKARLLRYRLLENYCHQTCILHLCLAHHQDDQIETYFIRKENKSDAFGLAGMPAIVYRKSLRYLRPFLHFSRAELSVFLKEKKIDQWVEDPSNENTHYQRIKIRKQLTSKDKQEALHAIKNYTIIRQKNEKKAAIYSYPYIYLSPLGFAFLYYDFLKEKHADLISLHVKALLLHVGCQEYGLGEKRIHHLLLQVDALKNDKIITIAGCCILKKKEKLYFFREMRHLKLNAKENIAGYWDNRYIIKAHLPDGVELRWVPYLKMTKNLKKSVFDYLSKINFPAAFFFTFPLIINLDETHITSYVMNRIKKIEFYNQKRYFTKIVYNPRHTLYNAFFQPLK